MKNENNFLNKMSKKQVNISLSMSTVINVVLFLVLSIPAIANIVLFLIWLL